MFIGHLTKFLAKIEYANENHLLAKGVGKTRLSYLIKNGFASTIVINDVLYILKAKANLLFLGQLSKQEINMKTTNAKMILSKKEKTIMKRLRIRHVWLMNSVS